MRKALIAAFAVAGLASCSLALATPVTWHMTAEVTGGNQGDFFFPFKLNAGDPIAFDFSFESSTVCSTCEETLRIYQDPLIAFTLTAGGTLFALPVDSSSISLLNDRPSPAGFFIDSLVLDFNGFDPSGIFFTSNLAIQNTGPRVPVAGINDVQLANLLPPDSSVFTDPTLSFFSFGASHDGGFDTFGGRFLTASVSQVPEPSALTLLMVGIGMLVISLRRARIRS